MDEFLSLFDSAVQAIQANPQTAESLLLTGLMLLLYALARPLLRLTCRAPGLVARPLAQLFQRRPPSELAALVLRLIESEQAQCSSAEVSCGPLFVCPRAERIGWDKADLSGHLSRKEARRILRAAAAAIERARRQRDREARRGIAAGMKAMLTPPPVPAAGATIAGLDWSYNPNTDQWTSHAVPPVNKSVRA